MHMRPLLFALCCSSFTTAAVAGPATSFEHGRDAWRSPEPDRAWASSFSPSGKIGGGEGSGFVGHRDLFQRSPGLRSADRGVGELPSSRLEGLQARSLGTRFGARGALLPSSAFHAERASFLDPNVTAARRLLRRQGCEKSLACVASPDLGFSVWRHYPWVVGGAVAKRVVVEKRRVTVRRAAIAHAAVADPASAMTVLQKLLLPPPGKAPAYAQTLVLDGFISDRH